MGAQKPRKYVERLECGSEAAAFLPGFHGGSFAAALQGASRIVTAAKNPPSTLSGVRHEQQGFFASLSMTVRARGMQSKTPSIDNG